MCSKAPLDHDYGQLLVLPPHVQRLERSLNLQPYLAYVEKVLKEPIDSEPSHSSEDESPTSKFPHTRNDGNKVINGMTVSRADRKSDKNRLFNFTRTRKNRKWVKALLCSDSSSEDEDCDMGNEHDLQQMLRLHQFEKYHRNKFYQHPDYHKYMYYSVGMLSSYDKHPEHYKQYDTPKKRIPKEQRKLEKRIKAELKKQKKARAAVYDDDEDGDDDEDDDDDEDAESGEIDPRVLEAILQRRKQSKKLTKNKKLTPEQALAKRRKIFASIAKKEIPRAQKVAASARKDMMVLLKKVSHQCMKERRRAAIQSQKVTKEAVQRAKRLTREMLAYWKRFEKVEKEHRKKAVKEAQEQRKIDGELKEARRQQRKLNFLITQTELYAHFMARKISGATDADRNRILSQLDDHNHVEERRELDGALLQDVNVVDHYDSAEMKRIALRNAKQAYDEHHAKQESFSDDMTASLNELNFANPSISTEADRPQPSIFSGVLKSYQLKGMNWLANLYNQGINGILADEMGLGKTVQTISLLALLAETFNIWGPFLIVAPASTLHNWQQECERFVPRFRAVPYWGNSQDRRILRKFWDHKGQQSEDSSFHIAITSYQLIIQDVKYFQRIKWQYMVLDEAQAIKSTASARWKILLGFNCRNRLLLTGTPIQNSMAELWALLHFIMPTLFDSHDEFNEWFSKDIESSVEKQSSIDEHQLSRLHMILKPFMLRRVKKDVENELSDKIKILVSCPLTTRQKTMYQAIKQKISIDDLLHSSTGSTTQAQSTTSSLMNIVMLFRKVCNHPDLCEKKEQQSPFFMDSPTYYIPKLIYREGILSTGLPSNRHILYNLLSIFNTHHIHSSIFHHDHPYVHSCFSFLRFINTSPAELHAIMLSGLLVRWLRVFLWLKTAYRIHHSYLWKTQERTFHSSLDNECLLMEPCRHTSFPNIGTSATLQPLVFTSHTSVIWSHEDVVLHYVPESRIHHKIRQREAHRHRPPSSPIKPTSPSKHRHLSDSEAPLPPHPHRHRPPKLLTCLPVSLPAFVSYSIPRVVSSSHSWYTIDRSAQWHAMSDALCATMDAHNSLLYGTTTLAVESRFSKTCFCPVPSAGLMASRPTHGYSHVYIPDKESLITDAGKLRVLDTLLERLKREGHRVLIYSQMTRMIDILEEYMWHRKHTYMRLDGSSKIAERRDMVADFQARSDIFAFLLSTRAGGLGINLTAADTVIFYDSDWNPTVDQQAMDRAHRLGQTKQVTVYRLVCKDSIEERILQRAEEKSEIQRMVMSGGNFKPDTLKAKEVVSLLIDDEEMQKKLLVRQEDKRLKEEMNKEKERKRKREKNGDKPPGKRGRKPGWRAHKTEENLTIPAPDTDSVASMDSLSLPVSPRSECLSVSSEKNSVGADDSSNDAMLVVDDAHTLYPSVIATAVKTVPKRGRSRGRPRGSTSSMVHKSVTPRRQRGRGSVKKALSAAEIAGAQAGLTAAYAAYGYNLTGLSGRGDAASVTPSVSPRTESPLPIKFSNNNTTSSHIPKP